MHKKNRRASKSEDPTAGKNEGNDGDKKSPHHPNGHRRHENNDGRGGGRDYRRDRPHHGRGGYYDDRRRDDRSGWRNNNDRGGGYGRGRDNYWDGRGRGGGWRDDRRDYGGRGGYQQNEREPPTNDRSRGRSRVGASLDPPLEVEVGATHNLLDLDHQAATHLGVIVEAIPEVSPARPLGIHTTRRHKIKNANEATLLTLREMKRRSTVGPIQTHQSRKVMRMPSQKISAPSLYLNLS